MALPALDPTNTERWWLDYSANDTVHSMLMRTQDEISAIDAAEAYDLFLTAIAGNLTTISIVGLRHAAVGSNITNPEPITGLAATYGSGVGSTINTPLQITFPGRSRDGRKMFVSVFGWISANDTNWRINTGEDSDVAAGVGVLNSLAAGGRFCTISGATTIFKPYANVGFNDYWVGQLRGAA